MTPPPVQTVAVELGERRYEVVIGQDLLADFARRLQAVLHPSRCFLLVDAALAEHPGRAVEATLRTAGHAVTRLPVPSGEQSKSFARLESLLETMLAEQPDRKSCLIALGGGMVGDLGGFAASLLLRGIDFVQLPSTLLAMVDSSVGGKTAINSTHGKNLIGAFWQPRLVVADLDLLRSLPPREWRAGYAEVVKYAALGDAGFFDWLETHAAAALDGEAEALRAMVAHCVTMKAAIVREDEREAGRRALLNFGHTLGHALEAECGFDGRLLHGEAVALGMLFAFRLATHLHARAGENTGVTAESEASRVALEAGARRLEGHLARFGLPVHPHAVRADWDAAALVRHCFGDKKAEGGRLTFVLPRGMGDCHVAKYVPEDAVRATLDAWLAEAA